MADGALHSLSLIPEVDYGVTPATPAWDKQRITGTTLALTKNTLQSEEIRDDRQPGDTRHGTRQVGGDVNGEMSYGTWDEVLEALFGGTWQTDTPIAGTDQLKAGTLRRSFSALRYFKDLPAGQKPYFVYTGLEANTMALTIAADANVTVTFGFIGKDQTVSETEPSGSTYNPTTTTEVMDSFTGVVKEGGTNIAIVTEITLNVENGIEPRFVVGSKTTIRPSIKRFVVTGQITAYFESTALLEKFLDETDSDLEFNLPDDAGNNYKFFLPKIVYTGGQPDVGGDGPITLAMPFTANYDATDGTNILIERS